MKNKPSFFCAIMTDFFKENGKPGIAQVSGVVENLYKKLEESPFLEELQNDLREIDEKTLTEELLDLSVRDIIDLIAALKKSKQ
jgi:hypothetical protein